MHLFSTALQPHRGSCALRHELNMIHRFNWLSSFNNFFNLSPILMECKISQAMTCIAEKSIIKAYTEKEQTFYWCIYGNLLMINE
jgi:hypothetical protein